MLTSAGKREVIAHVHFFGHLLEIIYSVGLLFALSLNILHCLAH